MKDSNGNGGRLIPAALILGAASLGSRLVGLLRERVLTTTFGAGDTFDAFVAAFRLPDLIFNLIVIGAMSAAFIPLFSAKLYGRDKDEKAAFDFSLAVLNTLLLVVGALLLLYVIFAPWIVWLITPGFTGEKMRLTVELSRIMAIQPLLLTVSFVFSGVLNSFKKFAAYALAPIVYNLGIIFGVWYLVPAIGISGLGWGVVLGGLLHMLVQLPGVVRVGFRWRPLVAWRSPDVQTLWQMMIPRVFGLAAQQINLLIVTILGSGLLAGSIAVFHLANNIQYLPIGIFGIAFAQAAFPTLAEHHARQEKAAFLHALTKTFRYILFFVVPITAFFILLRAQIVRVLFGDGAFDWHDTILTFQTLAWLSVSIFAQATVPLLTRAFYVERDTKTPVVISVISIVINILLALLLVPWWGVQGLAIAFSISSIANLLLLLGQVRRHFHGFDDQAVFSSLWRIVIASLLAGAMVQGLKYPLASIVDMQRFWGVATQLGGAVLGGVLTYLALCWLLRCEELVAVRTYLPRHFRPPAGTDTARFGGLSE